MRRSLAEERRINEVIFTGACNEFRRYAPILLSSLQPSPIFVPTLALRPANGRADSVSTCSLSVSKTQHGKTALQSAALEYMPRG